MKSRMIWTTTFGGSSQGHAALLNFLLYGELGQTAGSHLAHIINSRTILLAAPQLNRR